MLVLYVEETRSLYYAWLDRYGPHRGCSELHPWWCCARPLPPNSTISFEIDVNDRVENPMFETEVERNLYERQEILFDHQLFWPTVDPLVDDVNPRRFRSFNRNPDIGQYLEVSVIPNELKEHSGILLRAEKALNGKTAEIHQSVLQWQPRIGEARHSRAQFRTDGFFCIAWIRRFDALPHIELANLIDILHQTFIHWQTAIGPGVEATLEVAGLRVKGISIYHLGADYDLARYYFFGGISVSSDAPEAEVKRTLAANLKQQIEGFLCEPHPCSHDEARLIVPPKG